MAIERFCPNSFEHLSEFVRDTENDIDQMWICDKDHQYLGSLLPKMKGLDITYSTDQLTMVLYVSDHNRILHEKTLIINDIRDYGFEYV
jgi:hypothetical protein